MVEHSRPCNNGVIWFDFLRPRLIFLQELLFCSALCYPVKIEVA